MPSSSQDRPRRQESPGVRGRAPTPSTDPDNRGRSADSFRDSAYGGSPGPSPHRGSGKAGTSTSPPRARNRTPLHDSALGTPERSTSRQPVPQSASAPSGSAISAALVKYVSQSQSQSGATNTTTPANVNTEKRYVLHNNERRWVPYEASTTFKQDRWERSIERTLAKALTTGEVDARCKGFEAAVARHNDWSVPSKRAALDILKKKRGQRLASSNLDAAAKARAKVKVTTDNELVTWDKSCAERFKNAGTDQALLAVRSTLIPVMDAFARAHAPHGGYTPYRQKLQERMNTALRHQQELNAEAEQRRRAQQEKVLAEERRKREERLAEEKRKREEHLALERLKRLQPRAQQELARWTKRCEDTLYAANSYTELAIACHGLQKKHEPLERDYPILGESNVVQQNAYRDALWGAFSTRRGDLKKEGMEPSDHENGDWFPWRIAQSEPLDTSREWASASATPAAAAVRGPSASNQVPLNNARGASVQSSVYSSQSSAYSSSRGSSAASATAHPTKSKGGFMGAVSGLFNGSTSKPQKARSRRATRPTVEQQVGHNSENLTPELLKKLSDPKRPYQSNRAGTPGGPRDNRVRRDY